MSKKQDYKLRGLKSGDKQRISWEARVDSFRQIHGNTYEYQCKDYKNNKSKITITCKKHGDFDMFMVSHLKGAGCKKCKHENSKLYNLKSIPVDIRNQTRITNVIKSNKSRIVSAEDILCKLHKKHLDKFNYDLSGYENQKSIITLICPKHGRKNMSVERVLENKYGCPNCANINISHQEFEWLKSYNIHNHQHKIEYDGKFLYVDGIDLDNKIIYEYLGEYWHGHSSEETRTGSEFNRRCKKEFKLLFKETEIRFNILKSMGYRIIYRWSKESTDREFEGVLL